MNIKVTFEDFRTEVFLGVSSIELCYIHSIHQRDLVLGFDDLDDQVTVRGVHHFETLM